MRKLFGGQGAEASPELEGALTRLAAELPEVRWLVVCDESGIVKASPGVCVEPKKVTLAV